MEALIGIVGVAVLCFLLSALWDFTKKTEKEQQWQAVQMQDRKRKQRAEEEAERYRTSLVKRYKNSPLTREILKTICDGTERNPEEIVIDKSGASGRTDGMVRSYVFLAHRVPELTDSKAFPMNIIRFRILALPIVCLFVNKPHWRKPLGKFWERIILLNIRMTVESSSCG